MRVFLGLLRDSSAWGQRLPRCKPFASGCWRKVAASLVDLMEAADEDTGPMTDVLF